MRMRRGTLLFHFIFLSAVLIFPSLCLSDVKISLKNGRTIIADTCRETKESLICEKLGGTFSFSKKEIENLKEITVSRAEEPAEEEEEALEEPMEGQEKPAAVSQETPHAGTGVYTAATDPETARRLEQIQLKKMEMKVERDRMIADREQLFEDVKTAGTVRSQEKYDALKARIADLETRIKAFNADADRMNEEEKRLIEGQKK